MRTSLPVTVVAALLILNLAPSVWAKPGPTKDVIAFTDAPVAVRQTVEKNQGKQDVSDVVKMTEGDTTWYRIRVEGGERERLIYVSTTGRLMRITDATPEGSVEMKFEALPRRSRDAITAAANGNKILSITQVTKDGKTAYLAKVKRLGVVAVDEQGATVDEDDYTGAAQPAGEQPATPAALPAGRVKDQIAFTDMPEAVRRTVDDNKGRQSVMDCFRFTEARAVWYRVRVEGGERERLIYVSSTGRLMTIKNATPDGTKEVNFTELPRAAANAVKDLSGGNKILLITQITEGGKTFYRAQIKSKGFFVVDDNGKVVDDDEYVKPTIAPEAAAVPPRKHVNPHPNRTQREISYANLPGQVRETIGHNKHGDDQVTECLQFQEAGKTWYRARIETSTGRERVVYVDPDGKQTGMKDATPEGSKAVKYDELPGNVKGALNDEAEGNKIQKIVQVTENGKTIYRARIENKGVVIVDDAGNVVDED